MTCRRWSMTVSWSIPIYSAEGYFVANEIDRYTINSFMREAGELSVKDNKLVIYIQKEKPSDPEQAQNWLPARPRASASRRDSTVPTIHWSTEANRCPRRQGITRSGPVSVGHVFRLGRQPRRGCRLSRGLPGKERGQDAPSRNAHLKAMGLNVNTGTTIPYIPSDTGIPPEPE